MDKETKDKVVYASTIIVPIIIVIGLFLGGVSAGIITFNQPTSMANTGQASATISIDFGDGTVYTKEMTLENSTVLDFLLEAEEIGDIEVETTYWESFGGYSIDSITYDGKKYEGDMSTFWLFYINDLPAMDGADKVYVENGDLVEWKFESF